MSKDSAIVGPISFAIFCLQNKKTVCVKAYTINRMYAMTVYTKYLYTPSKFLIRFSRLWTLKVEIWATLRAKAWSKLLIKTRCKEAMKQN